MLPGKDFSMQFIQKELSKFIVYFILLILILHYFVDVAVTTAIIIAAVTGMISLIFNWVRHRAQNKNSR